MLGDEVGPRIRDWRKANGPPLLDGTATEPESAALWGFFGGAFPRRIDGERPDGSVDGGGGARRDRVLAAFPAGLLQSLRGRPVVQFTLAAAGKCWNVVQVFTATRTADRRRSCTVQPGGWSECSGFSR